MFSPVPADIWKFEKGISDQRADSLLTGPDSLELISQLTAKVSDLCDKEVIQLSVERTDAGDGDRVCLKIPVDSVFFDKFFNGCHGYRAQFYRSRENGSTFNRKVIDSIAPLLVAVISKVDLALDLRKAELSIQGSQSKVWLPIDSFAIETDNLLDISRWRKEPFKGIYLPMPNDLYVDFKGTFILREADGEIKHLKPIEERAQFLYERGYT
jgi:hypothetical protein